MSAKAQNTKNTTEEAFLSELRSQFEKLIDLRKAVDNKASTMITIASSIVTLNIVVGTFLITRIVNKDNNFYGASIAILAIGVILAVISIQRFIHSYGIKNYYYPMGSPSFFDNGEYKLEWVDEVRNLPEKEFNDRLFKGYLEAMKTAEENNQSKTHSIKHGQIFLTAALGTIVVLVLFVLVATGLRFITLS